MCVLIDKLSVYMYYIQARVVSSPSFFSPRANRPWHAGSETEPSGDDLALSDRQVHQCVGSLMLLHVSLLHHNREVYAYITCIYVYLRTYISLQWRKLFSP